MRITGPIVALIALVLPLGACGGTVVAPGADVDVTPTPPGASAEVLPDPAPRHTVTLDEQTLAPVGDYGECVGRARDAGEIDTNDPGMDLYRQGRDAERLGNAQVARQRWLALIQKFPESKLVPYAYYGFGAGFAREAAADPQKWEFADKSYEETLKYPDTPIRAIAQTEHARVFRETGDDRNSLASDRAAIDLARTGCVCSGEVIAHAREGIVAAFSRAGDPAKAFAFFRTTGSDEDARAMVRLLEIRFRAAGRTKDAEVAERAAGM